MLWTLRRVCSHQILAGASPVPFCCQDDICDSDRESLALAARAIALARDAPGGSPNLPFLNPASSMSAMDRRFQPLWSFLVRNVSGANICQGARRPIRLGESYVPVPGSALAENPGMALWLHSFVVIIV
jgi:hypothetical protein